jgi:hypothetical protein
MSLDKYDIVVVGAGPGGLAAALAAAHQGAKTAIIERYAFCGGMASTAGMSVYIDEPAGSKNLAGSIYTQMIDMLMECGGAYALDRQRSWVAVNREDLKSLADRLLEEAGVDVYYHCTLAEVKRNDRTIESVTVIGKSGMKYTFRATNFVDATGDADVAYLAGVETMFGRPEDQVCQPMSMLFRVGPVDVQRAVEAGAGLLEGKFLWWGGGYDSLRKFVQEAKDRNEWTIPKDCFSLMWSDPRCPELVAVNGTRIPGFSGADSAQLSQAEVEGRKQARAATQFMQKYLPGFEKAGLIDTGPQIGVRETRRIVGRYVLSGEDVLSCRKFEDQIAEACYCIDIHSTGSTGDVIRYLPRGEWYGIPYRCLLPASVDNLLVPGRALSATHEAASSARVMPICMTTGEAAGMGAAIAVEKRITAANVDPREINHSMARLKL